jgi:hypothetical protein
VPSGVAYAEHTNTPTKFLFFCAISISKAVRAYGEVRPESAVKKKKKKKKKILKGV